MTAAETFELGQRVIASEYLVRGRDIKAKQILAMGEAWPGMPEPLMADARRAIKRAEARQREGWESDYYHPGGYRVWLPVGLLRECHEREWGWFATHERRHPTVSDLTLPLEGIITRRVTISDGTVSYEEWGTQLNPHSTRQAYEVAYSLHRRPVRVLPEMLKAAGP